MIKKKLLFLIESLEIGGTEKRLIDLINNLDKEKYDCSVCTLYSGSLIEEYRRNKIKVSILNPRKLRGILCINKFFSILKFLKNKKFDFALCFQPTMITFGVVACYYNKIPILSFREGVLTDTYTKKKRLYLLKFANSLVNKIITVSNAVKQEVIKKESVTESNIKIIYNGLDIKKFDNLSKSSKLYKFKRKLIVGTTSRLDYPKDHKTLLKSISLVIRKVPNVKFLIVGDGVLKDELKNYSKKLKITSKVIFTGIKRNIPPLLKKLDLFVLSSNSEGFSLSNLEAMAASKPVITTKVGGIPEVVIDGKTGFLVPPKNPEILADMIVKLLNKPCLRKRMGIAGRKRVEKYFTIKRMIKEYEKLLR